MTFSFRLWQGRVGAAQAPCCRQLAQLQAWEHWPRSRDWESLRKHHTRILLALRLINFHGKIWGAASLLGECSDALKWNFQNRKDTSLPRAQPSAGGRGVNLFYTLVQVMLLFAIKLSAAGCVWPVSSCPPAALLVGMSPWGCCRLWVGLSSRFSHLMFYWAFLLCLTIN